MGESSGRPTTEKAPHDRLDSWKEIAAYLNRDITTVQRWEKREGMPVHRHQHDRIGSVYASRAELDAWARGRNLRASEEASGHGAPMQQPRSARRWKPWLAATAVLSLLAIGVGLWLQQTDYFWRSPLADVRFQTITDFDGREQAAAISRDGHLVSFLSDRDGQMDVWITQVGSGQFHNMTHGSMPKLVNPAIRSLGFSPDGSLVTFWARRKDAFDAGDISVWAVPTLGGQPRLYLEGAAELDWSRDGSRLAYHTPAPGDPLFVSEGIPRSTERPIFTSPAGLHAHYPLWSPDSKFIYFVQGTLPDKMDIWRIRPAGGAPEQVTFHNGKVSHPVLLDRRTLLYLAADQDGSGPWLYGVDTERRVPHRLASGVDRYSSLAASADGRKLVMTVSTPKRTLWKLSLGSPATGMKSPTPIALMTNSGFSPRLGPDFLLYVSDRGGKQSIWKLTNGAPTELWGESGEIFGGPAVSRDGNSIAFSVRQNAQSLLYVVQSDGTNARVVTSRLNLQGDPAWSPDGKSITSAANENGITHLFRIPLDGSAPVALVRDYSVNPVWSPDGRFVVYSGPDIGTRFSVKAVQPDGSPYPLPDLQLPRGARHLVFLPRGSSLVLLRGEINHKELWEFDLQTGAQRQLTDLGPDFDIRDFDLAPDSREVVLEREQERSNIVLGELVRP